jgi:hypothetical protein
MSEIQKIKKMKPSAYKSMMMGKLGLTKTTPKKKKDLIRWKNEKWVNLSARVYDNKILPCGQKGKRQQQLNIPSVCRPSIKVNDKTPKPLSKNISNKQIKKAINIKKQGKMINWSKL